MEQPIYPHPGSTADVVTLVMEVPILSGEAETEALRGELRYTSADPYAVSLVVEAQAAPVTWTFSRDLLADGIYEPTGDGDVQVWPCLSTDATAVIVIELHAPSGDAILQIPTRLAQRFVEDTFRAVPAGAEGSHLRLDALVADLLAS